MGDIKIPGSGDGSNGHTGDSSGDDDQGGFSVSDISAEPASAKDAVGDKVKVKFEKFVQLVATHDFEEVMENHPEEDIIISTDLLADLANAHEEDDENGGRKLPVIFLIGVILGIVVTYLLIQY